MYVCTGIDDISMPWDMKLWYWHAYRQAFRHVCRPAMCAYASIRMSINMCAHTTHASLCMCLFKCLYTVTCGMHASLLKKLVETVLMNGDMPVAHTSVHMRRYTCHQQKIPARCSSVYTCRCLHACPHYARAYTHVYTYRCTCPCAFRHAHARVHAHFHSHLYTCSVISWNADCLTLDLRRRPDAHARSMCLNMRASTWLAWRRTVVIASDCFIRMDGLVLATLARVKCRRRRVELESLAVTHPYSVWACYSAVCAKCNQDSTHTVYSRLGRPRKK